MNQKVNIDTHQLLNAFKEHLNLQFFAVSRTEAKTLYKSLVDDGRVPFMAIDLSDGGEISCDLELDHSDYHGKLNFGKFRTALAEMLLALHDKLDKEEKVNIMSSDAGDLLFNEPGVVQNEDGLNVMVSGMSQEPTGQLVLRLMYLHPEQFTVSS